MAQKEKEVQSLQEQVIDLQRQLAEAQAVIQVLTPLKQSIPRITSDRSYEQLYREMRQNWEQEKANSLASEKRLQSALIVVPHPLMIWRDDGQVIMVNAAWTKISGYTLEEIPTLAEWARKASGEGASERKSESLNEGFSQSEIKHWGEYQITTRSGEKRIWDFSTAPLGADEQGRRMVMAMAVDVTEHKKSEEELRAARDEAKWLARFPGENPSPVARVSDKGIVLYCNAPAASLRGWRCEVDTMLSRPLLDLVELAIEQEQLVEQDVSLGNKFYSVSVIPLLKQGYLNLYGRDITERKLAEKALEESERRQREITRLLELDQARLAAILRHLPVGVWIVDEQGRLVGSNPQAVRIWAGEVPVDNPLDLQKYVSWHPASGELLNPEEHPIAVALRTGETVPPMETNIRRFDGSAGTVLVSAVPIKDGLGRLIGVVAVNVEITERKKAEEALRTSEERFAKAFHASPNAVIISRLSDGLVMEVNEGWSTIFGHKPSEVVGHTTVELGVYANLEDWQTAIDQLGEKGFLRDYELQIRRTSGEMRQVSLSAERIEIHGEACLLAIIQDITEQKQAERALRESEQLLKGAQEIAHLGSWELDIINDRLTWSDEVYRIFGLQPQQFGATYEAFLEAVHPQDRAAVDEAYSGSIRDGRDQYEIEHRVVRHSSGEVRVVHEKCEHFRDQDGQIIRSIGMVHDITERKQAEEQLKDYAKRLERSNRELE